LAAVNEPHGVGRPAGAGPPRLAALVAALSCSLVPDLARAAVPPCTQPGTGWCLARRLTGFGAQTELGFRFGEPLDVDGDGRADLAAGARFTLQNKTLQNGTAAVWSGATGKLIRSWDGPWADGLFGHWVLPVPDLSGDRLADLVIAAPHATLEGRQTGLVVARSPKTGRELWQRAPEAGQNFGWDLTLAGDQNGDRHPDLFVGAPGAETGEVYLLSGRDGTVLRTYRPPVPTDSFGWYLARLDDLDGDGHPDLAVGAPFAANRAGEHVGAAWVLSSADGRVLHAWEGADPRGGFGGVVAAVPDVDHDGKQDLAIAAPGTEDQARSIPGQVRIVSTAAGGGKDLRHWVGTQPGELYGRMVVTTADLDGDGVGDVAIGAPWYRRGDADRVGRVELRSGRTGAVLGELVGDGFDCWFGWHIRPAPDPDGRGRPALLISSLRHPVDGKLGVGVVDLYVLGRADPAQGTITRGARRSAIK
jgi:FG-GAP repeat